MAYLALNSHLKKRETYAKLVRLKWAENNSLALLYAFAEKFVSKENMNKIKEVFLMTELGKLLKQVLNSGGDSFTPSEF